MYISMNRTHVSLMFLACCALTVSASVRGQDKNPSLAAELKQADLQELAVESAQRGDPERGKEIFHREKLGCVKCHIASPADIEPGLRAIGPDQRNVGDRLRPEQIVEAVLFPNKAIAKGYEAFVVVSVDGKAHKGVLVSQNARESCPCGSRKEGGAPESTGPTLKRCRQRDLQCPTGWWINSPVVRSFMI